MLPFNLCDKKALQFGAWTDPLSNDTIDFVIHREVGRAKDLSAPPRRGAGFEAELSHRSSVNFNNEWKYTSTPHTHVHGVMFDWHRGIFFTYYYKQSIWNRAVKLSEIYARLNKRLLYIRSGQGNLLKLAAVSCVTKYIWKWTFSYNRQNVEVNAHLKTKNCKFFWCWNQTNIDFLNALHSWGILTCCYLAFWNLFWAKSIHQTILTMNLKSPKARQLHNCKAVALHNHTLLHPVIYQGTVKYSPTSKDN